MRKKEDLCYKYREGKLNNMKYTTENALQEIKKRAKVIRHKRNRWITNILTISTSVCLIALFAAIGEFSGSEVIETQNAYGSFILPTKTSAYMLIVVFGIAAGAAVTLLVEYLKGK